MKVRKFYPRQALRRLHGVVPQALSAGEARALHFLFQKGRKLGYALYIGPVVPQEALNGLGHAEAFAVYSNCTTRIQLMPSV